MMKHKHAELIKAWADNTDIRFKKDGSAMPTLDIHSLINNPYGDWQIVKEPVVEVRYYRTGVVVCSENYGGGVGTAYFPTAGEENWNMKITITDGDIKNAKVDFG
jgi:hypothetical protein